jgi:hypothetical protein
MGDYAQYRAVLARIKSLPRGRIANKREYHKGALEVFVSLGLGSGANGHTFSQLSCGNSDIFIRGSASKPCLNPGVLVCSGVSKSQYSPFICARIFSDSFAHGQCHLVKVSTDWKRDNGK